MSVFCFSTKSDAVQKSMAAPNTLNIVSVIGEMCPPIRYFETGINTPKIVFAVNTQMCPFMRSFVIVKGANYTL